MKKFAIALTLSMLTLSTIWAQTSKDEDKIRRYSFQVRPLTYVALFIANGLASGDEAYNLQIEFEFQYAINNYLNLSISPYFGSNNSIYHGTDEDGYILNYYDNEYIKDFSYGIAAGVLYRPWKTWLKGMYVGLYPTIGMLHVNYHEVKDTLVSLGIMVESGYQWIFKNGFTLTAGGGIGYSDVISFPDNMGKYTKTHFLNYPFDFNIKFSLGYSF